MDMIKTNTLLEHPFLSGFNEKHIEILSKHASLKTFNEDELLIKQGEKAEEFYLIIHGEIEIMLLEEKLFSIPLSPLKDGDLVGWSWFYSPFIWQFNARAQSDVSVIAFDAIAVRAECYTNHSLGYELMKAVAKVMCKRMKAQRELIDRIVELNK